jgi:hypothetical protein
MYTQPPVDELAGKTRFITTTRSFHAFYRVSLPPSRQTLNFAAGIIIRRHRISTGSLLCWAHGKASLVPRVHSAIWHHYWPVTFGRLVGPVRRGEHS